MFGLVAFFLLFSLVVSDGSSGDSQSAVDEFCNTWYPQEVDTCKACIESSLDFESNANFVSSKRETDPSLCIGYYSNHTLTDYIANLLMNTQTFPLRMSGSGSSSTCSVPSVTRNTDYLNTLSFTQSQTRFVSYPITGALDLMWMKFKEIDPSFDVKFSVDMVIDKLGETASISEVLTYLKTEGVCSEEDYKNDPDQANPTCCKYHLSSYRQLRGLSSCDLAGKLASEALYVELALDPLHYMLSLCIDSHPIRHATNRYTVAGVLTGFSNPDKYWNVVVRRHVGGHNNVKVQILWQTGFAAITGHVYSVEVDPTSSANCVAARPTTAAPTTAVPTTAAPTESPFHAPKCGVAYNKCWLDHPNDAFLYCRECLVTNIFTFMSCPIYTTHIRVVEGTDMSGEVTVGSSAFMKHLCFEGNVMQSVTTLDVDCANCSPVLESLYFGEGAFTSYAANGSIPSPATGTLKGLQVRNCLQLKSIEMEKGTFGGYNAMELGYLPMLTTLKLGDIKVGGSTTCSNFCYMTDDLDHFMYNKNKNAPANPISISVGNGALSSIMESTFVGRFEVKGVNVEVVKGSGAFKQN